MTKTGKLYGDSLYELAVEKNREQSGYSKSLLNDLLIVKGLFAENPDYIRLLQEPSIPRKIRLGLVDKAFGDQADSYLVNFLKLLCEEELLGEFSGCVDEYKARFQKDHNIAEAHVVSAVALSESQKKALKAKLEEVWKKEIVLVTKTDPSLMGGMKVEIEGRQLDGSVRSRLERLHKLIEQ
mgnify:CR=1 FL=1